MAGLVLGARQRSDEKARVGAAAGPFGFRDNPPLAAPAVQGRPREVLEAARWPVGPFAVMARRFQLGGDRGAEAHIAGQAEQVIDPIQLAPAHQPLAGKAARNRIRTRGQRTRIWAMIRATSSTAPALASIFDRRNLAASR